MTAIIGSFSVQMYAELAPEKERAIKTMSVLNNWREITGRLEGVTELNFTGSEETGGGFELELNAKNEYVLANAVKYLLEALGSYQGIYAVRNELKNAEPEVRIVLKPQAHHLGLDTATVASQIGDAYGGLEVQRLQRGADEVKVILRYPKHWRSSLEKLSHSRIRTASGEWLPLLSIAKLQSSYAPATIMHRNGKRSAFIKANIDKTVSSPTEVYALLKQKVISELQAQYLGLKLIPSGELEEINNLKGGLIEALMLTLLLIYTLLAIPLKSYWQPIVIMSVIPFGLAGAAFGHLISDITLSVLSFFGMMALTGIVVNDSLVMLTRYNQLCAAGRDLDSALLEAGCSRFRAIFLTTITTVGGLMPLLSETSEQAQYLIPAAVSLAYGELFATAITLILVPLLVRIAADFGFKSRPLKPSMMQNA